jgi:hypothetical protein
MLRYAFRPAIVSMDDFECGFSVVSEDAAPMLARCGCQCPSNDKRVCSEGAPHMRSVSEALSEVL